jgi:Kef-type K+ transport system membrane component KefB
VLGKLHEIGFILRKRETTTSIFNGGNPLEAPLSLLILQMLLIICMTRCFAALLVYVRQPRVIAEVITGVVLGPSALGLIPGFTETMFPPESMPILKAFADMGLIFFMFLIGIELDPSMLKSNFKNSIIISLCGLVLPFALSVPLSYLMFSTLMPPDSGVSFTSFLLFIGVAMSITAFPILARILSDQKLLHTTVGTTSISAAACGDAVSWILLALTIAIVSAGSPLIALYVALTGAAFAIFMLWPIRILFAKLVGFIHSKRGGEEIDTFLVFVAFTLTLAAAWITEAIGIHAIFGAFLAGLATPHANGFSIKLTEKLEDFITILLVPLYFAYSGLRCDLTALNDGLVWGLFFLALAVACIGKIVGSAIPSKMLGLTWRESWTVGVLQNTKGLVELIVLNLGLDAGVINERIFVVMVLVCLVTTFATSPLVSWIYPQKVYGVALVHLEAEKNPEVDGLQAGQLKSWIDEGVWPKDISPVVRDLETALRLPVAQRNLNMLVCLTSSIHVAGCIAMTQLIGGYYRYEEERYRALGISDIRPKMLVFALRLVAMSERYSQLMLASEGDVTTLLRDPSLSLFRTYTQITQTPCIPSLALADAHEFALHINKASTESEATLIVLPWQPTEERDGKTIVDVMSRCPAPAIGVLVDRGFGSLGQVGQTLEPRNDTLFPSIAAPTTEEVRGDETTNIHCLFMGGSDDRECLVYALRMAAARDAHVTIVRFVLPTGVPLPPLEAQMTSVDLTHLSDQVYRNSDVNQMSLQSRTSIGQKSKWWQHLWASDQASQAESASGVSAHPMITHLSDLAVDGEEGKRDDDLFAMIRGCIDKEQSDVTVLDAPESQKELPKDASKDVVQKDLPKETATRKRAFSIGAIKDAFKIKSDDVPESVQMTQMASINQTSEAVPVIPTVQVIDEDAPASQSEFPQYDIPFMSKVVVMDVSTSYPMMTALEEAAKLTRHDVILCGRSGSLRNVDLTLEYRRLSTSGIPLKTGRSATWSGGLEQDVSSPLYRPASTVNLSDTLSKDVFKKNPSRLLTEVLGELGSRLTMMPSISASMLVFRSPQLLHEPSEHRM